MKKCLKGVFLCLVFLCLIGCERKVKLEFHNDETETYWEKDGIIYVYHHDEEMVTGYENYIIYPSYEKAKEAKNNYKLTPQIDNIKVINNYLVITFNERGFVYKRVADVKGFEEGYRLAKEQNKK